MSVTRHIASQAFIHSYIYAHPFKHSHHSSEAASSPTLCVPTDSVGTHKYLIVLQPVNQTFPARKPTGQSSKPTDICLSILQRAVHAEPCSHAPVTCESQDTHLSTAQGTWLIFQHTAKPNLTTGVDTDILPSASQ